VAATGHPLSDRVFDLYGHKHRTAKGVLRLNGSAFSCGDMRRGQSPVSTGS